jgi:hypothetical protein
MAEDDPKADLESIRAKMDERVANWLSPFGHRPAGAWKE